MCVCVKFGFFLGKTAVETVTVLKEAVKDKSMSKHKCMSGLIISKEVKCLLKTNHFLDPLQQAEMMKMLKKFIKLSLQTLVSPMMKFLK
jgi:hypothetical protein